MKIGANGNVNNAAMLKGNAKGKGVSEAGKKANFDGDMMKKVSGQNCCCNKGGAQGAGGAKAGGAQGAEGADGGKGDVMSQVMEMLKKIVELIKNQSEGGAQGAQGAKQA